MFCFSSPITLNIMKLLIALAFSLFFAQIGFAQTDTTSAVVKKAVLKETKVGGKLDFFTPIRGHDYESVQVKPRVFDTKSGFALISWGKAAYAAGVKSLDDAYSIFAEYKERPVNPREKEYIKLGYNREL